MSTKWVASGEKNTLGIASNYGHSILACTPTVAVNLGGPSFSFSPSKKINYGGEAFEVAYRWEEMK